MVIMKRNQQSRKNAIEAEANHDDDNDETELNSYFRESTTDSNLMKSQDELNSEYNTNSQRSSIVSNSRRRRRSSAEMKSLSRKPSRNSKTGSNGIC
jgi:hypothetical protein